MKSLLSRLVVIPLLAGSLAVSSCDKPESSINEVKDSGRIETSEQDPSEQTTPNNFGSERESKLETDVRNSEDLLLPIGESHTVSIDFIKKNEKMVIAYDSKTHKLSSKIIGREGFIAHTGSVFYLVVPKEIVLPSVSDTPSRGSPTSFYVNYLDSQKIKVIYPNDNDKFNSAAANFIIQFRAKYFPNKTGNISDEKCMGYRLSTGDVAGGIELKNTSDKSLPIGIFYGEILDPKSRGFIFAIPPSKE